MIVRPTLAAFLLSFGVGAGAQEAAEFRLILPVDCRPGIDCFVQNYVDTDAGAGAKDFTCGPLSYDRHKGTDVGLSSLSDMRRGVAVLAAANGRVRAFRDDMADRGVEGTDPEKLPARECGNNVMLTHADGWSTRYCHMKRGSIRVRPGQTVQRGEHLGEIGYSGKTAFPHLHLTVRKGRKVIDPFTGSAMNTGCGQAESKPLWTNTAMAALTYRSSGLVGAGFASKLPTADEVRDGQHRATELSTKAPILAFWTETFGLRTGDVERLLIFGPRGDVLVDDNAEPAVQNQAMGFRYAAKRRRAATWPSGSYRGEYRLLRRREGRVVEVLRIERVIRVR